MGSKLYKTEFLKQDLVDSISQGECGEYFVGIHGIDIDNFRQYVLREDYENFKHIKTAMDVYNNILKDGLLVLDGFTSSTVFNLGLGKNLNEKQLNYRFPGSKEIFNVLVAVPPYMIIGGKKYFVGDLSGGYDERRKRFLYTVLTTCVLNKRVPKEYIYGAYSANTNYDKVVSFHRNLSHVSLMNDFEQKMFFENLFQQSGLELDLLEMILEEKVSPIVDCLTTLVEHRDDMTMFNVVCNTINRKRIYENSNIPVSAVRKVLKRKNNFYNQF